MIFRLLLFSGIFIILCNAQNLATNNSDSNEIKIGRRIYGGSWVIGNSSLRFVARLRVVFRDKSSIICSGTVITDRVILTATTCLYWDKKEPFYVGAMVASTEYIFWGGEILINSDNNQNTLSAGNLAALKLGPKRHAIKGLSSSDFPQLIKNDTNENFENSAAVVAGWGKTSQNDVTTRGLKRVDVNTISNGDCNLFLKFLGSNVEVTNKHICSLDYSKGTCWGDEGGPLLIERQSTTYLVGITLESITECEKFGPTIYTRIDAHQDWITTITR